MKLSGIRGGGGGGGLQAKFEISLFRDTFYFNKLCEPQKGGGGGCNKSIYFL